MQAGILNFLYSKIICISPELQKKRGKFYERSVDIAGHTYQSFGAKALVSEP